MLKGELFPSARLSYSGTNMPPKQQCNKLAASDTSSAYIMSCNTSSSSSAGVITIMTTPTITATATSSSASNSYNDAWSMVGPTTTASRRVNGARSSQNNYEMELLLNDIHTSLNMVEDCFDPTASATVNNNRRTNLSFSGATEAVVEQPSHRGRAVPMAETFLCGLSFTEQQIYQLLPLLPRASLMKLPLDLLLLLLEILLLVSQIMSRKN
jgi:hypothetical protein